MKWFWLYDANLAQAKAANSYTKSHAVPEVLRDSLIKNLEQRLKAKGTIPNLVVEEMSSASFDLPGMMMTDRTEFHFEVDGLELIIPATDFEDTLNILKNLSRRGELIEPYFKMHFFHRCLCLTVTQQAVMLQKMADRLLEASATADAENKIFNERMDAMKSAHVKIIGKKPVRGKTNPNGKNN